MPRIKKNVVAVEPKEPAPAAEKQPVLKTHTVKREYRVTIENQKGEKIDSIVVNAESALDSLRKAFERRRGIMSVDSGEFGFDD